VQKALKIYPLWRIIMKMSELKSGDKAVVVSVKQGTEVTRRLADMGVTNGAEFKVVRKAPMGDPMEIKIDRFLMALRLEEADRIEVELISRGKKAAAVKKNG
jgi:Fe2+ transport system protein FeoA